MKKIFYVLLAFVMLSCGNTPVELNVMTFNIRYDNPEDSLNNWQYRKDVAANIVRMKNIDLLGTQEVLINQLNDLKERLSDYNAVGVGREDGKEAGEHSAIFYKKTRFTEVESGTFWLSETPEVPGSKGWDGACERVATWAILKEKTTNRKLLFMNTHLDHVGKEARQEGVTLLLNKAKERGQGMPVIITGDFNAHSDSDVIAHVTASGEFRNSNTIAKEAIGEYGTFHAFGRIPEKRRSVIDYIFVTTPIEVAAYEILPDKLNDIYLSDHTPVTARIVIP